MNIIYINLLYSTYKNVLTLTTKSKTVPWVSPIHRRGNYLLFIHC